MFLLIGGIKMVVEEISIYRGKEILIITMRRRWIVDTDWKTYPGGDGVTVETDAYQRIQQAGCVHTGIKATLEYVSTQLKCLRPNGKLTLSFRSKYFQWYWGWTVSKSFERDQRQVCFSFNNRDYAEGLRGGGGDTTNSLKGLFSTFVDRARSSFEKSFVIT